MFIPSNLEGAMNRWIHRCTNTSPVSSKRLIKALIGTLNALQVAAERKTTGSCRILRWLRGSLRDPMAASNGIGKCNRCKQPMFEHPMGSGVRRHPWMNIQRLPCCSGHNRSTSGRAHTLDLQLGLKIIFFAVGPSSQLLLNRK